MKNTKTFCLGCEMLVRSEGQDCLQKPVYETETCAWIVNTLLAFCKSLITILCSGTGFMFRHKAVCGPVIFHRRNHSIDHILGSVLQILEGKGFTVR
jgi:hypothetical protein